MSGTFFMMMAAGAKRPSQSTFDITIAVTADNLQFGVTPWWNAGGGCEIAWGDGQSTTATTSSTQLTHTYAETGTYKVKVQGDMYRFRVGSTNPAAVVACNGNWGALGNITTGTQMFYNCSNALLTFASLPPNLAACQSMFEGCGVATLPLTAIPDSITNANYMFQGCLAAELNLTALPSSLTNAGYMFYNCRKATFNLDDFTANAPAGGWPMTSMNSFARFAGLNNSPGTVTGSRAAFQAKCPNATNWTDAFQGTNTTA